MRRLALLAAVAAVLAALAVWRLAGPRTDGPGPARGGAEQALDAEAGGAVDLSLRGIELTHGEAGRLLWRLRAGQAVYGQEEGVVDIRDVEIVYYAEQTNGSLTVRAPEGRVEQKQGLARLWPDVRAVSPPNRLRAGELLYDGGRREIVLTGDVRLEGPALECNATTMRVDLRTTNIVAENGVSAVVLLDDLANATQEVAAP